MKTIEKKEPFLHTLNTQGNIYEEFLPDQVLTHKNLNKVVNYFEDQDRLSRVYLIGVGIGCGIDIVSYSESEIVIGQGVGITTDGDIIKTETRRFQYYGELTDRANYALFEGKQVYEVYEQEEAGRLTDELPLSSFTSTEPGSLKEYILVAYVENYTEDEGLCGGSGCDETGNKVYSNLKFLLIHKNNYNDLISEDTIYRSHDVLAYYDSLPELCLPRLLLTKDNTTSGISIHNQFKDSFFLKADLYNGISTIINKFQHRINFAKFGVTIAQIANYLDDIFTVGEEQFIQYKYDLLKDLIDTYQEIRDLVLHTRFECVANINAFPKHLLLGTLESQTRLQTRHNFYPSPTVSENEENLLAIRALCIRFFNQLKEYKIPNVSTAAIKVTPSRSYEFKLSERSIPYYYETKNSLISNWNPIAIQQRKSKHQLGYHVSNLANIPCVQKPLEYNHLGKDFYRIEGHLGKDFRLALRKINSLKSKYNLAFDVKAVSIGFPVNKVTLDDDKCETKDYSILLKTWEQEFNCTAESATEFFQKYQYDNLGDNDTSTSVYYGYANYQPMYVLELLNKRKKKANATEETTNIDKLAARTINTNVASAEAQVEARYESSIQYAMDQAYQYIGNQNVPAGYVSGVALGIIDEILGNVNRDDDYFFYTESAVKIVAGLSEIKRLFLQSLDEIYITEKWTALNNAIDVLCADVDQVLFAISEAGENSTFGSRTHDKMYEYFIYDLSKLCCLKDKFAWLKTQIDAIRYDIYKELILSRLIEKHPGAEHMAGVPKGGTFLMVYLGGTEELLEDDSILRQFNGIVQFDFALPYMCCSDCPPETIVYNLEPETTLTIAKTKYCLPLDEGQIDFIIQSSGDGVVTSPQGDAFIVETENGYAFNPAAVPAELTGIALTFLVDGKTPVTPVEIYVYRFPSDIDATYTLLSWTDTGIKLDLSVAHEALAYPYNFTYYWQREDDSEIGFGTHISELFFETVDETFVETFKVTIGIEGEPDACSVFDTTTVEEARPIEISVSVPEIICHNLMETSPEWTQVLITPSNGILTSPQETVQGQSFILQNQNGEYFIDPARVPNELAGEEITFAVNGTNVSGVSTRVAKLPVVINIDEQGAPLQPYLVQGWDDTGVKVSIRAAHQFQDKTYIEYRWTNTDTGEVIGNTRFISDIIIPAEEIATANLELQMRVIGLEDSCTASFSVNFTIPRPTLDIPTAICFGRSISLDVSTDTNITSEQGDFFENISGTITFVSTLVPDELIGQPIEIFIDNVSVATTIVYKIPETVTADAEVVGWEGTDLIVNLVANYELPNVSNPENYLEIIWLNESGNQLSTINEHRIPSTNGNVQRTYMVKVSVRADLGIQNPCETDMIPVTINEDVPVTIPPNLGLRESYCWQNGEINVTIPVVPSQSRIVSPQGSVFIQENAQSYTFLGHNVPDNLAGDPIEFRIEGSVTVVGTTRVYKIPTENSIQHDRENSLWGNGVYLIRLKHTYSSENYLSYEVIRNETGEPLEQDVNGRFIIPADTSINESVKVRVFVEGECSTDSILVPIEDARNTDEPVTDPTTPQERLDCTKTYQDRLDILEISLALTNIEQKIKSTAFEGQLRRDIIDPFNNLKNLLTKSSNLDADIDNAISAINEMRRRLQGEFLSKPELISFRKQFLLLDELMELLTLEMLRCTDAVTDNNIGLINEFFDASLEINGAYDTNSRSKINDVYIENYTSGSSFVSDRFLLSFNK
ncbi:hypothetical protein [Kordia zhangzhouensis]|uniref:hypothetical protein n=1 Tax=Kordia zhangzhouensis TaxID=1620405 RepID=UPI000629C36E|nr:hypothetical protein [Kordia zhangzhouensis]